MVGGLADVAELDLGFAADLWFPWSRCGGTQPVMLRPGCLSGGGGLVPASQGDDAVPLCGSDDLAVVVKWEHGSPGLDGQVIAENVSGRACRLAYKPEVTPLHPDGTPLPVGVRPGESGLVRRLYGSEGARAGSRPKDALSTSSTPWTAHSATARLPERLSPHFLPVTPLSAIA
jgi:hypothetical protein